MSGGQGGYGSTAGGGADSATAPGSAGSDGSYPNGHTAGGAGGGAGVTGGNGGSGFDYAMGVVGGRGGTSPHADGEAAAPAIYGAGGGGGGGGAHGALVTSSAVLAASRGGRGGGGGSSLDGGGGGGGAGGYGTVVTGDNLTLDNFGTQAQAGGAGGAGGHGANGGGGGSGGIGLDITGTGVKLFNGGAISGGSGGAGGAGGFSQADGAAGAGGAGLVGAALAVVNGGSITGGVWGDGQVRAAAIDFTGGANSLQIAAGSVITGAISLDTDSTSLELAQPQDATLSNAIVGSGSLSKSGAGVLTLTGNSAFIGGTTVSAGTLRIGDGQAAGSLAGDVVDNAALEFSRSDATAFAGAISGSGSVKADGGGVLTLGAANTYRGGTTVTGGATLVAAHAVSGHGVITPAADSLGSGGVNLDGGTLEFSTPNVEVARANAISVQPGSSANGLTFSGGGMAILEAPLSGAGDLTVRASGDLILSLSGADTNRGFTGAFTLARGTLQTLAGSDLSAAAVTLNAGATYDLGREANSTVGSLAGAGAVTTATTPGARHLTAGGNGASTVFSGVISDGAGVLSLEKAGTGVLTLTGANTYHGVTTVSAGTLRIGDGQAAGSIAGDVLDDAQLEFSRSDTVAFRGMIAGGGSVVVDDGVLMLNATNTYSGGTTVSGGAAVVAGHADSSANFAVDSLGTGPVTLDNGAIGIDAGTFAAINHDITVLAGGGKLDVGTSNTSLYASLHGSGALTLTGAAYSNLFLQRADSGYTGAVTIAQGTAWAQDAHALTSSNAVTIASGAGLKISASSLSLGSLAGGGGVSGNAAAAALTVGSLGMSTVFSGVISDGAAAVSLEKAGTGVLTLTGANTYHGVTTVSAGTLRIGDGHTAGSIAGGVVDNAALAFSRSDATTFAGAISGSGSVEVNGGGVLTLTGANTFTGGATIGAGTALVIGDGATSGSIAGNVVDNGGLYFHRSDRVIFGGAISGSGSVTADGGGVLTLGAANTYRGGTTVTGGATLADASAGGGGVADSLGTSVVTLSAGTLAFGTADVVVSNAISVQGSSANGLSFAGAGTATLNAPLSGAGALTASARGNLILSVSGNGSNSGFTGAFTLAGGTLQTATPDSDLSAAKVTLNAGATYDLGRELFARVGSLAGAGTVTSTTAGVRHLTVGDDGASTVFSGVISDGTGLVSLAKGGAGVLTLTGANSFTQGAAVNAGVLRIGDGGAAGSIVGDVAVAGNAALEFSRSDATIFGGGIFGAGAVKVDGGGVLTLAEANAYHGGTTVTGGATLRIGDGHTAGSIVGDVVDDSRLVFSRSDDVTFAGAISGSGVVRVEAGGALTLTGMSAFTGGAFVLGGALVVAGSIASGVTVDAGLLGGTGAVGAVSVANGATLSPGGYVAGASTVGRLTTGAVTLAAGAHVAVQLGVGGACDQVSASGNVALGGASLDLSVLNGSAPAKGVAYDILHLTNGAITGQFAQGSSVTVGGYAYTIGYTATDVTLSYVPPPPPPPPGPPGGAHLLGAGADAYQAGAGGEIVYGGGGSDTLLGGAGADMLVAGAYQSTAGAASDRVLIEGGGGADSLGGGLGHDLLLGQTGDDHILVAAGSQGDSAFGGQGSDLIDASRSNAPNYLSGDIGNDTLLSGAGFETVLGGQGDDVVMGGSTAGPGSMQMLFGNQGNDRLSYAGSGGVELFGGQDSDTLSLTATQAGQARYAFGNLGSDTLTAVGGADSLYGGQGDDVVSAAGDLAGGNYLSGDLGDDVVTASQAGSDTLRGGQGADTLVLTAHSGAKGDSVVIGAGESTSSAASDESNVQHVLGFTPGRDRLVLAGHAAPDAGGLATFVGGDNASEAAAFAAAYVYAFGDGAAAPAHVGADGYLAVQESYAGTTATYLFTADHHVIALVGVSALALGSAGEAGA